MRRVEFERRYWDKAATDPDVDKKYISDLPTSICLQAIGGFNGNILEIGCGVGRLMKSDYYGTDISQKMLDIAQKRRPDCHFRLGNGRVLPFPSNYFDVVYSLLVFQHLPRQAVRGYIREANRVLKSGGKFRFQFIAGQDRSPFSRHYPIRTIKQWLGETGFTVKTVATGLVHYQWTWITAIKL